MKKLSVVETGHPNVLSLVFTRRKVFSLTNIVRLLLGQLCEVRASGNTRRSAPKSGGSGPCWRAIVPEM
jgi:hypothetical protein